MRKFVLSAGLLFVTPVMAHANIPDYCAAFARDYADMGEKSTDWQRRHDDAQSSCITRFSAFAATPVKAKPKLKVVAVAKPIEAKSEPKKELPPETKIVAKSIPKLETGTAEWISYCKQKYVSFDEGKGTYLSKTGVERKCLVTAD
jgi:BA14K-like protein